MNVNTLRDIPPWDWPDDTGQMHDGLHALLEEKVDELAKRRRR